MCSCDKACCCNAVFGPLLFPEETYEEKFKRMENDPHTKLLKKMYEKQLKK